MKNDIDSGNRRLVNSIQLQDDAANGYLNTNYYEDDTHNTNYGYSNTALADYITNLVKDETSIQAKVKQVKQFLENEESDGYLCNEYLSNIIDIFRIEFGTCFRGFNHKLILLKPKITEINDSSLETWDNITTLAKKLIIVGADIDYKVYFTSPPLLDSLTYMFKLYNEYKLGVQKLEEIFACIIANDLFKLNPKITEHLMDIKECLGKEQFAALKEDVTSEFINMMQQSHETAKNIEQSLNFIEQINPELISPLSELKTVKTDIGHMLLECLGLSIVDPEILKANYNKEGDQFVLNSKNSLSMFSEQDQALHIKTLEFYEKYPACIDQLLDIVTGNPELKEQLIDNLQQNSELRTTFQGYITLSPIIAVLLQTNLQEVILEITKISSLEGIAHINIGEYNPDVASSLLGEEQKDDHLEY